MKTYKQQSTKIIKHVPISLICDKCKKEYFYNKDEDIFEIQEFHHINFQGGYSSIFGDGKIVSYDICQHCLYKWLINDKIKKDLPSKTLLEILDCEI